MRRQHDLHDLLTVAAALVRAPAAYMTLPDRGRQSVAASYGPLPTRLSVPLKAPQQPLVQELLPPLNELAQAPWRYVFQIRVPVPLVREQEAGTLCFLTHGFLDPDAISFREGMDALKRQIALVLSRPDDDSPEESPVTAPAPRGGRSRRGEAPSALPSIEDLPGIGTFEIRFGSNLISLSAELMRLTGVPTGTQCPIEVFQNCMPVPDTDLLHFAEGISDEIQFPETDFAIENLTDQTRSWVRRRAEIEADERGTPWRLIGTLEDITRDRVATNRLSAMVILGDALRKVDTPAEAYHAAASALADALGADRAGWALFEASDETHFRIVQDWHSAGLPSAAGTYDRSDYSVALNMLEQGVLFSVRDAHENVWLPCLVPEHGNKDQIRSQLLMPVLSQGHLTHCLYIQCCTPRDWTDQELAFLRAVSDRAQVAAASLEARAHQQTMHQELAHRLKNTLALVQALANQSLRGVDNRDAVKAFEKRLVALGSAHDLLMRQAWRSGDLETLAREVLARIAPIERFHLAGPPVSLGPNTATTLGLMLHELGTNAAKYGALSAEAGRVSLVWSVVTEEARRNLSLHWREEGGPPVAAPQSKGFGSRLLQAGFGHQGSAAVAYPETGCDALFTLPLRQAQSN
ncbi:sensor histidine kinase [Asaia spathodeae]|uniref:histidine kinase n=1 Tax=Asaia spathodeae TaxID=657016 RepID=A0ABX2P459_9PROT|nr:HWE histidine kinase domain-containing protein [Asaia spathodeae]GBR22714.1 signal transduction histidine kinase [Asaia spathodeae NBRC 105894]